MKQARRRKLFAAGVCAAALSVAAVSGTMAYLQDTDSDVNVMTMGNVDIVQHEYQRVVNDDGTYKTDNYDNQTSYVLEAFEQGKALLPATDSTNNGAGTWADTTVRMSQVGSYGGMQVFANPNAQDKFVTIENAGKTDAYVRTLVAIEVGTGSVDLLGISARATDDVTDAGVNTPWFKNQVGVVSIDDVNYYMLEYVYAGGKLSDGTYRHANGVLPAGDTTYPNLAQVYLKSSATNEDMEALDGNNNGTLDILVLSQAVQADGFADATTALDAAFGDITTTNHPWADGVEVPVAVTDADELADALAAGESVVLTDDVEAVGVTIDGEASLNLNGKTLTGDIIAKNADLVITNGTINDETADGSGIEINAGTLKLDNVKIVSDRHPVRIDGKVVATIDGGEFLVTGEEEMTTHAINVSGEATVTINGGTFKGIKGTPYGNSMGGSAVKVQAGATVTINGGTFSGGVNDTLSCDAGGTLIVKGGTFDQDPSDYVAEGYAATSNDDGTWTVSKSTTA